MIYKDDALGDEELQEARVADLVGLGTVTHGRRTQGAEVGAGPRAGPGAGPGPGAGAGAGAGRDR